MPVENGRKYPVLQNIGGIGHKKTSNKTPPSTNLAVNYDVTKRFDHTRLRADAA